MIAAVVQLNSQDDVAENLRRVAVLVGEAAKAGAELVVLPENFAFMGEEAQKFEVAESVDVGVATERRGPIVTALAGLAVFHGIHIVGGGMPERSDDPKRPFNTSVCIAPDGGVAARYRKIHLFDVSLADGSEYKESGGTSAGSEVVTVDVARVDTSTVKLGLTVCYDLRFPELFRRLTDDGATVITVPAAFTLLTGKDHWHVLLRARAIENGVFIVAAAQHGKHPRGRQTYGKSLIVDPWGDVLAQCGEGEGFAIARIDGAYQARVRASLPSLQHRRL